MYFIVYQYIVKTNSFLMSPSAHIGARCKSDTSTHFFSFHKKTRVILSFTGQSQGCLQQSVLNL